TWSARPTSRDLFAALSQSWKDWLLLFEKRSSRSSERTTCPSKSAPAADLDPTTRRSHRKAFRLSASIRAHLDESRRVRQRRPVARLAGHTIPAITAPATALRVSIAGSWSRTPER